MPNRRNDDGKYNESDQIYVIFNDSRKLEQPSNSVVQRISNNE